MRLIRLIRLYIDAGGTEAGGAWRAAPGRCASQSTQHHFHRPAYIPPVSGTRDTHDTRSTVFLSSTVLLGIGVAAAK